MSYDFMERVTGQAAEAEAAKSPSARAELEVYYHARLSELAEAADAYAAVLLSLAQRLASGIKDTGKPG